MSTWRGGRTGRSGADPRALKRTSEQSLRAREPSSHSRAESRRTCDDWADMFTGHMESRIGDAQGNSQIYPPGLSGGGSPAGLSVLSLFGASASLRVNQ